MHRNKVWIGFLILLTFITLWFAGKASNELIDYMLLSHAAPIEVVEYSSEKTGVSKYQPKVLYNFTHNDQLFSANSLLDKHYPNEWACEKSLAQLKNSSHYVWFNPSKPEAGVLNKSFPIKSVLSAVAMIAIIVYFFCLGQYASKKIQ